MKTIVSLLLLLVAAPCAFTQTLTTTWLAPIETVAPDSDVTLELLAVNRSAVPATFVSPEALPGLLVAPDRRWPITLRATAPPPAFAPPAPAPGAPGSSVPLPAGGFGSQAFRFTLPAGAVGRIVLEIDGPHAARVVLDVGSAGAPDVASAATTVNGSSAEAAQTASRAAGAPTVGPQALPTTAGVQPALSRVQRAFADRFSEHLPVYFIYGPDDPVAKFQFSFKYRLFGDSPDGEAGGSALRGLHFGYTQRSLWDIAGSSSPFYDSSYMPELVFEALTPASVNPDGWLHWLGFQAGFQHESNGRDGPGSRSLNIAYVRPVVMIGRFDGFHLILAPRVFAYVGGLADNEDLRDYRGNAEFTAVFGKNNHLAIAATARFGDDFERGSVEVNLTYPVRFSFGNFASFFLVQYFEGYGESLLNYNLRSSTVRAGFSLVR